MKKAYINPHLCDQSPACPAMRICPQKAIHQEKLSFFSRGPSYVDEALCTGCSKCITACPANAIKLRPVTKSEAS